MQLKMKMHEDTTTFLSPVLELMKYITARMMRIAAKIRKVTEVPTAGIVTNVGMKVPMMLPIVLKAPSVPTVRPLSSRSSTVYLASEGVTVPKRKSGKTKTTMQAANAAIVRKLLFTAKIKAPEIRSITYFPRTGISAIQTAATRILA